MYIVLCTEDTLASEGGTASKGMSCPHLSVRHSLECFQGASTQEQGKPAAPFQSCPGVLPRVAAHWNEASLMYLVSHALECCPGWQHPGARQPQEGSELVFSENQA